MSEAALSVEELSNDITLHIYPGSDGHFTMYEDAGDGYGYENGDYELTEFTWNDAVGELLENGYASGRRVVLHK